MIITEEEYNKYFDYLINNQAELNCDEQKTRELLSAHLKNIPDGKLYKYRTCNRINFNTLKTQQIFMPAATSFKDVFDYTLNFDVVKEAENLKKWLVEHLDDFIYNSLSNYLKNNGINSNVTKDQIERIHKTYFTEEGEIIKNKFIRYINAKQPGMGLKIYDKIVGTIEVYSKEFSKDLEKMCLGILASIRNDNYKVREKSLVYCLTEDKSNGPMWENYADNYTGFCIEYDFNRLDNKKFADIKNLVYLLPISYVKEKPIFSLIPFLEIAMGEFFGKNSEMPNEMLVEINKQLLRKDFLYSYEKEWRFSIKNEQNHLQSFPFASAIYMGKDITTVNEKHLKVIAKKLGVPLYKQILNFSGNNFDYILVAG